MRPKEDKKTTGRPPKYRSPEEMQKAIDKYFTDCSGEPYTEEGGTPKTNKWGMIIYKTSPKSLTITGLALAIGFNSRQSFFDYMERNKSGEDEVAAHTGSVDLSGQHFSKSRC